MLTPGILVTTPLLGSGKLPSSVWFRVYCNDATHLQSGGALLSTDTLQITSKLTGVRSYEQRNALCTTYVVGCSILERAAHLQAIGHCCRSEDAVGLENLQKVDRFKVRERMRHLAEEFRNILHPHLLCECNKAVCASSCDHAAVLGDRKKGRLCNHWTLEGATADSPSSTVSMACSCPLAAAACTHPPAPDRWQPSAAASCYHGSICHEDTSILFSPK